MNLAIVKTMPLSISAMRAADMRRQIAAKAHACVKWLEVQGFDVLQVEAGLTGPRIIIRHCFLCDRLEGVVDGYSRGPQGELRYQFVQRFDCEVRWSNVEKAVQHG